MCKAGKSENYSTTYGQESIMHGIWEGCMHGRTTRVYLIMGQWARMQCLWMCSNVIKNLDTIIFYV